MVESKILRHFFEEQHEKYKKKMHTIFHSVRANANLQPYDSEWSKRKEEIESLSFHPFEIEPGDNQKPKKPE